MKKHSALENALGRLDDLDNTSLAMLVQRLARERKLFETVFSTIREGILVLGRGGLIEYANPAAASLLGFPLGEVGRANFWKRVPELARTLHGALEPDLPEGAGLTRELELTYPEYRQVRVTLLPLPSPREKRKRAERLYTVIVSDLTREKEGTRQALESERVNSILQLAAGVAHELGNPLNSLTIHLQLMRRQTKGLKDRAAGKLDRSIDVCLAEVERLDGIITHFLQAVRPVAPDLADTELLAVLEESLHFLGPELADAGITVEVEVSASLPVVLADRNQLKQIFFNLLKNAREAMQPGGAIRIQTRYDDDWVYLLVADNGAGIPQEHLSKIFQPYFSTKSGGSGLGMMIAQRIMRAHGGQIGIDSRAGVGTVVTLQFPQKHRRVRLLEAGEPAPSSAPGQPPASSPGPADG